MCTNDCHLQIKKSSFKKERSPVWKNLSSVMSSLFLLLLPKCPFCLLAYSSVVTLCSASGVMEYTTHHTGWGAYAALTLGIIITVFILTTFKTKRSVLQYIITSLLAIIGLLFIYTGIFHFRQMNLYYVGSALILLATLTYKSFFLKFLQKLKYRSTAV